jgi:hypothetical protein
MDSVIIYLILICKRRAGAPRTVEMYRYSYNIFGSVEKLNTFVRTCADGILLLLLLLFPFDTIFSVCSRYNNKYIEHHNKYNKQIIYAKQIYYIRTYINKCHVCIIQNYSSEIGMVFFFFSIPKYHD